jgi:hypothetical protein
MGREDRTDGKKSTTRQVCGPSIPNAERQICLPFKGFDIARPSQPVLLPVQRASKLEEALVEWLPEGPEAGPVLLPDINKHSSTMAVKKTRIDPVQNASVAAHRLQIDPHIRASQPARVSA